MKIEKMYLNYLTQLRQIKKHLFKAKCNKETDAFVNYLRGKETILIEIVKEFERKFPELLELEFQQNMKGLTLGKN